jgi:hypothetical protein
MPSLGSGQTCREPSWGDLPFSPPVQPRSGLCLFVFIFEQHVGCATTTPLAERRPEAFSFSTYVPVTFCGLTRIDQIWM